jgi:uncharacterized protein (DUF305 family)
MSTRRSTRAAVGGGALTLCLTLTLSACGGSAALTGTSPGSPDSAPAAAGAEHNDADLRFARTMIPHHRQALDMAELAVVRAQNPEVKALAEQIRSAQAPEIDMLTDLLAVWGAPPADSGTDHPDPGHAGMGGMIGQDQMNALAGAGGATFDPMFLEMMIVHHEGAVADARREVTEGANAQAKQLAAQIVTGQTTEIERMRVLLAR